jgi:hypothetical protein
MLLCRRAPAVVLRVDEGEDEDEAVAVEDEERMIWRV